MQILQAKVRCLKGVVDTGWFKPGRKMTILLGKKQERVSQLLRGLEALKPLYDITTVDPLGDHLATWQQGDHRRHVIQEKKTAVYMIFDSEPELVKSLSLLDDSLIETDRIELGRRLDYSLWISFVELPASARWSDIAEDMHALKDQQVGKKGAPQGVDDTFFNDCKPTDRIKGDLAARCRQWLLAHSSFQSGDSAVLFERCRQKVDLHERFKLSCRFIEEYLPPTVLLQPDTPVRERYSFAQIYTDTPATEPLAALLQQLSDRFGPAPLKNGDFGRIRKAISDAVSSSPLSRYDATLSVDESGFALAGPAKTASGPLAKRLLLLWGVALLTRILWQRFPILLLDRYDSNLSGRDRCQLAGWLKEFAGHTQLLLTPSRLENVQDYESAKILRMSSDGPVLEKSHYWS